MTGVHRSSKLEEFKAQLEADGDSVREVLRAALQEVLEGQMTEALGAVKRERTPGPGRLPLGPLCAAFDDAGRIELRVPQDRNELSGTELFERCERSEKALVSALMQMYVNGVSTRKVAKAAEELRGYGLSAPTVSRINAKLDAELAKFAERSLEDAFPYVFLDARYEKVRDDGVVRDRAVLVAIGVDAGGSRRRRASSVLV